MALSQVLTDVETDILLKIALNGKKTYKQLFKEKVANSNKTVLYSLKRLEYMTLIKGETGENEGENIAGRKATYYKLTPDGLLMALYYHWEKIAKNEPQKKLANIAKNCAELLPLVLGKLRFFYKNNLDETFFCRLYASVFSEGPKLEQWVKLRRLSMKLELKREKRSRQVLAELKKFLSPSELKGFPQHPVYMSDEEKEKELRALLKVLGETEKNESIQAGKIINEGAYESTSKNITETFFFGSNRVRIDSEKETEFLKKIVKDKDLHKYVIEWIRETEKHYVEYLKNIRSWKKLVE